MNNSLICHETILDPIGFERFRNEYYEKKVLHISREEPNFYTQFGSLEFFEKYLRTDSILSSRVVLMNQGNIYQPPKDEFSSFIDGEKILEKMHEGFSIRILALDVDMVSIKELCKYLQNVWGYLVKANLYITPPIQQGSRLHYDDHDVLILQLSGTKVWSVAESSEVPSVWGNANTLDTNTSRKLGTYIIKEGDLLYIPQGVAHVAKASEQISVHLTLGIQVPTWKDVLHAAVDVASLRSIHFMDRLPLLHDKSSQESTLLAKHFSQLANDFASQCGAKNLFDSLNYSLTKQSDKISDVHSPVEIVTDVYWRKRPDFLYSLSKHTNTVEFVAGPRRLIFDLKFNDAFKLIISAMQFTVRDISWGFSESEGQWLLGVLKAEGLILPAISDKNNT